MKRGHFEAIRPVCPLCRGQRGDSNPLGITAVHEEEGDRIRHGMLGCSFEGCQMEFPVIDGIPILVADLRNYLSTQLTHLLWRWDLPQPIESILGDSNGPGSSFDATRQHLSSYCWDHYGDRAEGCPEEDWTPGGVVRALDIGLGDEALPKGPLLDAGCSVGRSSFELAARSDELVLGVDLNFSMLRIAHALLDDGEASWPLRRVGVVYDRVRSTWNEPGRDRLDFWCADALSLPFADESFGFASALNLLDCVNSPIALLGEFERVLRPEASLLCGTPYDWSPSATPIESWVGGHSQRGPLAGAAEPFLRTLLTPGAHPQSLAQLQIRSEREDVPWQVRLHSRSLMNYRLHLFRATKATS